MVEELKQSEPNPLVIYRNAVTDAERRAGEAVRRVRQFEMLAADLEQQSTAAFARMRGCLALMTVEEVVELQARRQALSAMIESAGAELRILARRVREANQAVLDAKARLREEEKALAAREERARYAR